MRRRLLISRCYCSRIRVPPARPVCGAEGLRRAEVPARRAVRRRAGEPGVRRAGRSAHLLRRDRLRRRVEVDRRRPHLEADLRRPADQLDRLHRGRAVATRTWSTSAPARRTFAATSRRAPASSRATDAGKTWKHVWKQDGQIGTMAVAPHERGHRLRRGAGPRLRAELRTRRLPHHRRRQDLEARALQERRHRRRAMSASTRITRG